MEKVTMFNPTFNKSIVISTNLITLGNKYFLQDHNFRDSNSIPIYEKTPLLVGSSLAAVERERISLTLQFAIAAKTRTELLDLRQDVRRVFNVLLFNNILTYEEEDIKRIATIQTSSLTFDTVNGRPNREFVTALIDIPNGFWEEELTNTLKLTNISGGLQYPLQFPIQFATSGLQTTVFNNGDFRTPLQVEFFGPVTNPELGNTFVDFEGNTVVQEMRFIIDILAGEKLTIDTTDGVKTVVLTKTDGSTENKSNTFDGDEWIQLQVGENTVTFDSTSGVESDVILKYKERFNSI